MILAGFQLHGITPGPLLFKTSAHLAYALFAAFILANVVMLIVEYFGLPVFTKLLSVPSSYLLPVVIAFCIAGSFSANNRTFDIMVMMLFGFIGFIMKRFAYPLAPMVVGFILAPMLEENLRRSLMRTDGSFLPILQSPIALLFLVLTVVMVIFTVRGEIRDAKKERFLRARSTKRAGVKLFFTFLPFLILCEGDKTPSQSRESCSFRYRL